MGRVMKPKKPAVPIRAPDDLFEKVGVALRLAVADAIEEHRRSGHPLAVWQDGRVVLLPPDQAVMPESPARRKRTR